MVKQTRLSIFLIVILLISCSSSEVIPPELISNKQLSYPLEAQIDGLEGECILMLKITEEGKVGEVMIRKSAGYELLDEAAIDYVNELEFKPATKDDDPTEVWLTWAIDFQLSRFANLNKTEGLFDVLVFTETEGFKHESIQAGVNSLTLLAEENNFDLDVTSNSHLFKDNVLKNYDVIVFLNTSGDVLTKFEQQAMQNFIRRGGGFVGVHGATNTEYDWEWYGDLIGAYFDDHPEVQSATINVVDQDHISTAHLPARWERVDEWYNLRSGLPDDFRVLATIDETTYEGGKHGSNHPFTWCHNFDGGRAWVTLGGHTLESYKEEMFLDHLLGGIKYAAKKN